MHLTDAVIRRLEPPGRGNKITYDDKVKGLGARVTAAGARSFVLTYSVRGNGRQRRYTIGSCDDWTCVQARDKARDLKRLIDDGGDPLAEIEEQRAAPTVADLVKRFEEEHVSDLRPSSAASYRTLLKYILSVGANIKVRDVRYEDIAALHRRITRAGHSYNANRCLAVASRMFSLAVRWGWRETNPCKGVERNKEHSRQRYLTADEMARLTRALAEFPDRDMADIVRLLLLTGARKSEILTMKWGSDLDLSRGIWTKPASRTKQNQPHQVPLSAPACQLLSEIEQRRAGNRSEYVFPGTGKHGHIRYIFNAWRRLCKAADIVNLRLHDLRHSFASELVSSGASLPLIGALLGHSSPATTHRYAHLYPDAQRAAVERVGAAISNAGKKPSEPLTFKSRR
jgi:integrase